MPKATIFLLFIAHLIIHNKVLSQTPADSIVLRDIEWDKSSPAGTRELTIPSGGGLLQGFIYKANGIQRHPTLLLLHGYPGNERNLDLAQVVRANGWNVIYFNYRGSWGSQGEFSFKHCVEDVVNVVAFCKKYADSLQIDPSRIALFGHSMGGWVCLKALQQLPDVKKGIALSAWNIFDVTTNNESLASREKKADEYFVLNKKSGKDLFKPVFEDPEYYNLTNTAETLVQKQIIMLEEYQRNPSVADAIKSKNKAFFEYDVWQTDHSFTNKRVALINKVLSFLNK
ncbi:MAG TPA: alpha/beta fold hydrolase [Chitinophagaceae bacterium]|nr:alpha/beta fold hydrolase [Chitinophagaceae bacterium]